MSAVNELVGISWCVALDDITSDYDTGIHQLTDKPLHEVVLARDKQGGEHRIVVVPTPSPTEAILVLHHLVGNKATPYCVNTKRANTLDKGL